MHFKKEESSSLKELMVIGTDDNILIDARLLHQRLQVSTKFTVWVQRRIDEYGFESNKDFFPNLGKTSGGRKPDEYHLTMDMAKELAMLERNEIGRSIRRYFIKAEKEARFVRLPVDYQLPIELPVIQINNRELLPYRDFIVSLGITPGGSIYKRKASYPNHFVDFNGKSHVTVELAHIIGMNWLLIKRRKHAKQMQPVLPLEFGTPLQMKGAQA